MLRGSVKWYSAYKGQGFIIPDDKGEDVFFLTSAIVPISPLGLPGLYPGQRVEYQLGESAKPQATTVRNAEPARTSGTVRSFDRSKGAGSIELASDAGLAEVSYRDIEGPPNAYKFLREGEPVELTLAPKASAVRVVRLDPRIALFRFAEAGSFTFEKFNLLAKLAQAEEWDYQEQPLGNCPILQYYIVQTFERVWKQDKILFNEASMEESTLACFNTGLVTDLHEDLLAVFEKRTEERNGPKDPWTPSWRLRGFFRASSAILASFPQSEFPLATYFTEVTELFLDPKVRIDLRKEHILVDNLKRFPESLQSQDAARGALERAFQDARRRLERNYKAAVPQFYNGKVELLLPLALEDPKIVDRALVL